VILPDLHRRQAAPRSTVPLRLADADAGREAGRRDERGRRGARAPRPGAGARGVAPAALRRADPRRGPLVLLGSARARRTESFLGLLAPTSTHAQVTRSLPTPPFVPRRSAGGTEDRDWEPFVSAGASGRSAASSDGFTSPSKLEEGGGRTGAADERTPGARRGDRDRHVCHSVLEHLTSGPRGPGGHRSGGGGDPGEILQDRAVQGAGEGRDPGARAAVPPPARSPDRPGRDRRRLPQRRKSLRGGLQDG
jgi:hypothetical protein